MDQTHGTADLATSEVIAAEQLPKDAHPRRVRACEQALLLSLELRRWRESRVRGKNLYLEYSGFIRRDDGVLELRGKLMEEFPGGIIHMRGDDGMLLRVPVPPASQSEQGA